MITILKKFILSFIFLLIVFWIYKFLFYTNLGDKEYFEVLTMSLFMSLLMLTVHVVILKIRGFKISDKAHLKLKITKNKSEIIDTIQNNFNNWKLDSNTANKLIFIVKPNFITSFGEKVHIDFEADNEAVIRSKSLLPSILFDYGNNLKNIRELNNLLC